MQYLASLLLLLLAAAHTWFLVLEMFLWTHPIGLKTFGRTLADAQSSAVLAANQGLYNGFLAAGLVWAAFASEATLTVRVFFTGCVLVAGLYGGYSASRKIFFVQALPAFIALVVCLLAGSSR